MKHRVVYYIWTMVTHVSDMMQQSSQPYPHCATRQTAIGRHVAELKRDLAVAAIDHPALHGCKVYSLSDEDGIIEYLLGRLPDGMATQTFIEVGCGDGVENNSHYLLLKGYRGVWVDGSAQNIAAIRRRLGEIGRARLLLAGSFVDLDNIDALSAEWVVFLGTPEIDFLSMDIDGNDA